MTDPFTSDAQPARRGYVPPRNDREQFLFKRCQELALLAQRQGMPKYTGFLSDREQSLAQAAMHRAQWEWYSFEGGYPAAERRVLCIEPPDTWQEYPVACIRIRPQAGTAKLPGHKDYLGAMLNLGLERECVGDILLGEEGRFAVAFVLENKAEFICRELTMVGGASVALDLLEAPSAEDIPVPQRTIQSVSLSSLRVDAFLAAVMNCSRSTAAEYIRAGRVEINHIPVQRPHEDIFEQDIFTVRGKGRFKLERIGGKSRKDRTFVEYFAY